MRICDAAWSISRSSSSVSAMSAAPFRVWLADRLAGVVAAEATGRTFLEVPV
jgi:hypothetical protein